MNDASYEIKNKVDGRALSEYIHGVIQNNGKEPEPIPVPTSEPCRRIPCMYIELNLN